MAQVVSHWAHKGPPFQFLTVRFTGPEITADAIHFHPLAKELVFDAHAPNKAVVFGSW